MRPSSSITFLLQNFFAIVTGMVLSLISPAQNLIPNADFENYRFCPATMQTIEDGALIDWFQPVTACTPDYFNVCATKRCSTIPSNTMGYQKPYSGNGYIGLWAHLVGPVPSYTGEFVACQLKSQMEKGKEYKIRMNISLSNFSKWSLTSLGVAFTSFYPTFPAASMVTVIPHLQKTNGDQMSDTANWMPLEYTYTANGNENFMMIGNFNWLGTNAKKVPYKVDAPFWNGAYYYIDSIGVEEISPVTPVVSIEIPVVDSLADEKKIFRNKYADAFAKGYVLTRVFFDVDKYNLKPESDLSLDSLVTFMKLFPDLKIEIAGNTDSTATEPYNQVLSQNRAEEVRKYLISNGISESRMVPVGYASSRPLATNATVDGRARNRRVEFRVIE